MKNKTPYTYLEAEMMEREYDEQSPLKVIAEYANKEFHGGEEVRNAKSVSYVVYKMNHDDEWRNRLEEKWMHGKGDPQ